MHSERDERWNRFISEVCYRDVTALSEIQKKAVLCFWYDAEMNNGGFSGYSDVFPDTDLKELESALKEVANDDFVDNLRKAIRDGKADGWVETDREFYIFEPSLSTLLEEYVEANKDVIFD